MCALRWAINIQLSVTLTCVTHVTDFTIASMRVLVTTSRSEERRPGVDRVALNEEAVRSAGQRAALRRNRGECAFAVERHLRSGARCLGRVVLP